MIRCPNRSRGRCGSVPNVVVTVRKANYSAFNGYKWTPSDYSELRCLDCGRRWRSRAKGVDSVRNAVGDEATRSI